MGNDLITDISCEVPFPVFAEFEVITVVARYLGRHTLAAPIPIDPGPASHGSSQVTPRSVSFIFIYELEPFLRAQASSTVEEISWHHSQQRGMILFVDGDSEPTPESRPASFCRSNSGCRALRQRHIRDAQKKQGRKRIRFLRHGVLNSIMDSGEQLDLCTLDFVLGDLTLTLPRPRL